MKTKSFNDEEKCSIFLTSVLFLFSVFCVLIFLGCGGRKNNPVTTSTNSIKTAQQVSAGYMHSCALMSTGTVKCWGQNSDGQLGNGIYTNSPTTPVDVLNLSDVTAISAGNSHNCVLTSSNTVKCWGYNYDGQLGDGTTTDSSTPVDVSGLSDVIAISAGDSHNCVLTSTGTVKCWGYNYFGQLGNETSSGPETCKGYACSTTPVNVSNLSDVTTISAGEYHSCALMSTGTVKCWGQNSDGQLGNGANSGPQTCNGYDCSTTPVDVDNSLYAFKTLLKNYLLAFTYTQ